VAEQLVWIADASCQPMELSCGHTTEGNGRSTPYTRQPPRTGDEWYCAMCPLRIVHQLDQELDHVQDPFSQHQLPASSPGIHQPMLR
jgi:hypothetical protein